MAATANRLTLEEFEATYAHSERSYEYWYGEAVPKSMPTWIHGLLQSLISELLRHSGFKAGSEVELRVERSAHPKPDVVATRGKVELPYPTQGLDVVVEILSEDDPMPYVLQKCRAYHKWGFTLIYVVDPDSRSIFQWIGQALTIVDELAAIPGASIWAELDKALAQ